MKTHCISLLVQGGIHRVINGSIEKVKQLDVTRLGVVGDTLFAVGNDLVAKFDGVIWRGNRIPIS